VRQLGLVEERNGLGVEEMTKKGIVRARQWASLVRVMNYLS
jgi:hypothetical protein